MISSHFLIKKHTDQVLNLKAFVVVVVVAMVLALLGPDFVHA